MRRNVSKSKAWAMFDYWFEHNGHWVFGTNGKGKAEESWSHRGIEGLPPYPGARH